MSEVIVSIADTSINVEICEEEVIVLSGESGPQGPRGSQVIHGTTNPDPEIGIVGDTYINTETGFIFGPKTESGWGSGTPLGFNDPADMGYVHNQAVASASWTINHTLSFIPNILVVDSAGTEIEGDYNYINANTIVANFSNPFAGKAYLS